MYIQHFIGLDIHKKSIWFCVKDITGKVISRGKFPATAEAIESWCQSRPAPWSGLMEATMFAHWIYDRMRPFAAELRIGHPVAMKALLLTKNKTDEQDAERFAEMARCNLVPALYVPSQAVRSLRRHLRIRNLLQRQIVQLKNRMAAILMEVGVAYDSRKLHTNRYYQTLLDNSAIPAEVRLLVGTLRQQYLALAHAQRGLYRYLEKAPEIRRRIELLQTIPGVGRITALTWALEVGEVSRFSSHGHAISYCGLVSARNESAGTDRGGPLSKKRNKYLQHVLIECAHLAPRFYWKFAEVYNRTAHRQHANAATIAVARKIVSYLIAVDRSGQPFVPAIQPTGVESSGTENLVVAGTV